MPRGTLFRMAQQKNIFSDIKLLEKLADPSDYENVRIVTLREHAHECATVEVVQFSNDGIRLVGSSDAVDELLHTKYKTMKEFVKVFDDHILVGVNATTIDDASIGYAIQLLMDIPDLTEGTFIELGDEIPLT